MPYIYMPAGEKVVRIEQHTDRVWVLTENGAGGYAWINVPEPNDAPRIERPQIIPFGN